MACKWGNKHACGAFSFRGCYLRLSECGTLAGTTASWCASFARGLSVDEAPDRPRFVSVVRTLACCWRTRDASLACGMF